MHDQRALEYLIDTVGAEHVMLGTDYPFPLGEQSPGELIANLPGREAQQEHLNFRTALRWLGLNDDI